MQHIVETYLGGYQDIESGNQYYYYCPKCHWKNPRLSVNYDKDVYHCWYCGFSGRSILYLLYYVDADSSDIEEYKKIVGKERLLESADGNIGKFRKKIEDILKLRYEDRKRTYGIQPKETWKPAINMRGDFFGKRAYSYLRKRKLSSFEIKFYNIMVDEEDDTLILPSYDRNGMMNYYVKHDYLNSYYTNPEGLNKSDIIFFDRYVNFKEPIIITEGVYDAINIGYNAVPILGKLIHNPLIDQLVINNTPLVYIFFDGDATSEAFNVYEYLRNYSLNVRVVETPEGEDANSLARCDIDKMVASSKKYNFKEIIQLKLS